MPGSLDSCINNVYADGSIPASSGLTPVRVLLKDALAAAVSEAATALDSTDFVAGYFATISEAATAVDTPDATLPLTARSAMLPGVFINSSGTPRQAMAGDVMANL